MVMSPMSDIYVQQLWRAYCVCDNYGSDSIDHDFIHTQCHVLRTKAVKYQISTMAIVNG